MISVSFDPSRLQFNAADGLLPCIVQDNITRNVLMLGYMNEESLRKTIAEGKVTFFSRSKQRLWTKGETSGNYLHVIKIDVDCDQDTLLIKARPDGPTCHTGADTCFNEVNDAFSLESLQGIIQDRKKNPKAGSYTTSLFEKGINKIAQKVGEESVELVIESKDQNEALFLNEAADLMFHYLILLTEKGYQLDDVVQVLKKRHR